MGLIGTFLGNNQTSNQGSQQNIMTQGSRSQATGITPSDLDRQNDLELEFDKARDSSTEEEKTGAFPGLRERRLEQSMRVESGIQQLRQQSEETPPTVGSVIDKPIPEEGPIQREVFDKLTEDRTAQPGGPIARTGEAQGFDIIIAQETEKKEKAEAGAAAVPALAIVAAIKEKKIAGFEQLKEIQQSVGFGGTGMPEFQGFDEIPELSLNTKPRSFRSDQLKLLIENT